VQPRAIRQCPLLLIVVAAACSAPSSTLPPLGEALIIVDTDVPVPLLAGRLRVDVFTSDGTWYESRDYDRSLTGDWPVSFGIYSPDPNSGRSAILRLRAYPPGKVRDYRGERYAPRPSGGDPGATAPPPVMIDGDGPRLLASDGTDITPATEPQPLLTIDRLLLVTVTPGVVGSVRVVMRGACFGTMADLGGVRTCIDTENTLAPLTRAQIDPDRSTPASSLENTFGGLVPCTATPRSASTAPDGTPLYDEEVCVPGQGYVFGSLTYTGYGEGDAVPERVAIADPFRMDKYEVTVGRFRQALRDGFKPPSPLRTNNGAFPTVPSQTMSADPRYCTYSDQPMGRETYPMNCVDWPTARAFCQSYGGDLPLEVQWELATSLSGRPSKTPYPWGGDDLHAPTCDQAVFGRCIEYSTNDKEDCSSQGYGPMPVDARVHEGGDLSLGLGIADLAGSLGEWMADSSHSMGDNCWMTQPLHMPSCTDPNAVLTSIRGGDWATWGDQIDYGGRIGGKPTYAEPPNGFRCVRGGTP
jgi:formylglycine-generating enzyme required for sulfatase activity